MSVTAAADNALRYAGKPGHVESWFIRANDPDSPRAVWLKITILAPLDAQPVAESWFIWFDGSKTFTHKETVPFSAATFDPPSAAGCRFELNAPGSARGVVGPYSYALEWPQAASEPLCMFPTRALLKLPLPKSKWVTPFPALALSGEVKLPTGTVKLDRWPGMQGHNWGKEHAHEYAWGQCLFDDGTMVEGVSGRILIAGKATPRMGHMVIRRNGEELRFDRTFDFFNQESNIGPHRWSMRLKGPAGRARLRMDALDRPMACLGYLNPDGHLSYCFNTKLAEVLLEVEPKKGPAFRCKSAFGGALELLKHAPEPGVEVV